MSPNGPLRAGNAGSCGVPERRRGIALVPVLIIVLLSTVVAGAALLSQQWALAQAERTASGEGFFWSVTQYQIAHQRLKQELRAIAAGEPVPPEALTQRWAVLESRASILTEPSEVRTMLKGVAGFEEATRRVAELHQRVAPLLEQAAFSQASAAKVLSSMKDAGDEALLSQLGNDVRQAELVAKEELLRSLHRRLSWAWAGFGLCWGLLALWLLYATHAARRYARAATERQQAVLAMEQAISTKRRFLGMVSHELRSPLQSIVTAAESLSRDTALGQSRPQSASAIRRIEVAVSGIQAQMRDLLTIARNDTGEIGLQRETFDCSELVRDVCADFEAAAAAKGLAFQVVLPQTPQTANADPIRIAQVLRNLLQNAVRYTSAGTVGVRLLEADALPIGAPVGSDCMRFTVSDTGPGLAAEDASRLQSDQAAFELGSETLDESMRIGLFVIRDVLRQLGGRIQVQSQPGQGTVARVEIPVAAADDSAAAAPEPKLSGREGDNGEPDPLHVLIVDDSPEVLRALQEAVQHLGHHGEVAASANDAQTLLARQAYDVVLIDLEMPGMNGLALARDIRSGALDNAAGPARNAQSMLILISAPDNRDVGLHPPFDGFLQKPISAEDLKKLIGSRTRH